jgi:hypothetical protein
MLTAIGIPVFYGNEIYSTALQDLSARDDAEK